MRQHDDEVGDDPRELVNAADEIDAQDDGSDDGSSSPLADLEAEDLARDAGDAALYPEAFDEGGDL